MANEEELKKFFSEDVIRHSKDKTRKKVLNTMMNSGLTEEMPRPVGHLSIYEDSVADHNLLTESNNMIVQGYRHASIHLLPGVVDYRITQLRISVGTNPPAFYDQNLQYPNFTADEVFVKEKLTMEEGRDYELASSDINAIALNIIKFTWEIEPEEGNNGAAKTYTEAGMFCGNGSMFSRVVYEPIIKTPQRKLIFLWQITYN